LLGLAWPKQNETAALLWNGVDVRHSKIPQGFRNQIAFLPQEPFVIEGTLLDNIVFPKSASNADDHVKAREALSKACLNSRGLLEDSQNLSGGERQRLMFARAFFRQPRLWILDEATSALDLETEARVMNNMKETQNTQMCLIVAHRHSLQKYSNQTLLFTKSTQ
jgi:ABC-type transport system involved in cytochrome bd biosynthesis fused ATPase/permease subunit